MRNKGMEETTISLICNKYNVMSMDVTKHMNNSCFQSCMNGKITMDIIANSINITSK